MNTFYIKGVHCESCVNKIKNSLPKEIEVIDLKKITGRFTVKTDLNYEDLKKKIDIIAPGFYFLQKNPPYFYIIKQVFLKYRPIILGLFSVSILSIFLNGSYMANFMALYFLVFGLLKLVSLKKFAEMYSQYDILAKKSKIFAYFYPFLELIFAFFYFTKPHSLILNITVLIIMLIKAYGVYKVLIDKKEVKCACLGASFSVPISYVTFGEDMLMVLMAGYMILIVI